MSAASPPTNLIACQGTIRANSQRDYTIDLFITQLCESEGIHEDLERHNLIAGH